MRAWPAAAVALLALPRAASADPIALGARAGPQSIFLEGDGSPSDLRGYVAGIDVTMPLSHHLGLAGVVEASLYDRRSDRLEPGAAATSYGAFAELRVDTHPEGPWSCRIDLGTGYRWLLLPLASGPTDAYGGIEPLRLRLGPAYRTGPLEVSVALGAGFGWFIARPGAHSCAVTATCQDSLLDSDTASPVHFVGDLSVAVRGWP
jgi:hypothetical protein